MADFKLTDEVRGVLDRSAIDATTVRLPEQLPRPLYEKVNTVLVNAGGKWNRKAGAHVFASDPRVKLGLVLETGVSVDKKKALQAFNTPKAVCETVVAFAEIEPGMSVLEPSAGIGMLALEARDAGGDVQCVEIDAECADALGRLVGIKAVCADFMKMEPSPMFDRVVMNPPFAKNQDVKHVVQALKFLKPGGVLVAVMWPNLERPAMRALLAGRRTFIKPVDGGAFKESGTEVPVVIVTIRT